MKCYQHPDADAVGVCISCGQGVCDVCAVIIGHKLYCKTDADKSMAADEECKLLRDEYVAQVPAHASYILALVVAFVVLVPNFFSALHDYFGVIPSGNPLWLVDSEIGFLTVALALIVILAFRESGRLLYFLELDAITANMLGTSGPKAKKQFDDAILYVRDHAPFYGISAVVFAELFVQMTYSCILDNKRTFMIHYSWQRWLIRHFSPWESPKDSDETSTKLRELLNESCDKFLSEEFGNRFRSQNNQKS